MPAGRQARERLLEGFLLRLAGARDADAYALRGGMLVRQWAPGARRRVRDVDLACRLPYRGRDVRDVRARLGDVLRRDARDGVAFDAERLRVDSTSADPAKPMLSLRARGCVDGDVAELGVDLAFGVDVWPAAALGEVATERGGVAAVWTSARETVIATKLGVIAELGARGWRPKDLADIWLGATRGPWSRSVLGAALEQRFGSARAGAAILAAPWWLDDRAAMRWGRHDASVELGLDVALGEVRAQLARVA